MTLLSVFVPSLGDNDLAFLANDTMNANNPKMRDNWLSFSQLDSLSHGTLGIIEKAYSSFRNLGGIESAAGTAFFAIFGFPPLLIVVVTIGSFFLNTQQLHDYIVSFVVSNIPVPSTIIVSFIDQFFGQRNSFGIVGFIFLVWSASGIFMTLTHNISRAWPSAKLRNIIHNRSLSLAMVGILGAMLVLLSFIINIFDLIEKVPFTKIQISSLFSGFDEVFIFIFRVIVFTLVYYLIPNTKVNLRAAVIGAFAASLAWGITALGFNYYLNRGLNYYNLIYGPLGTLVAFMFWIYLDCLIIVFCAHLTASIQDKLTFVEQNEVIDNYL